MIYGTMDDGIGLGKYIRSQHPIRYDLKGFVSHDTTYHHYRIMGVKVYDVNDQLINVIEKNNQANQAKSSRILINASIVIALLIIALLLILYRLNRKKDGR